VELTRRQLLGGTGGMLLAGGLASCGASHPPRLPGGAVPCGVDAVNLDSYESVTGPTAHYLRVYHAPQQPLPRSITGAPEVASYLSGGRHVVISFTPTRGGPDQANLDRFGDWCASAAQAGYARLIRATVYHEPVHKIASGADFVGQYTAFQQVAAAHGIPFGVIHNAYPFARGKATLASWMPPPATWDYLGIDVYAGDDPRGTWYDPLATIGRFTSYAASRNRPYSICEVGVDQRLYTTAAAQASARGWLSRFSGLSGDCRWLCYFDYAAWSLSGNNGALVPAYRTLARGLQSR
jgi:hypothetical protein